MGDDVPHRKSRGIGGDAGEKRPAAKERGLMRKVVGGGHSPKNG